MATVCNTFHHKHVYWILLIEEILDNYAIVPSFQDWRFPEESLPKIWPNIPDLALPHSSICSVTNVTYAVDNAYVVPQEEIAWYRLNLLIHSDIEDEGNIIPLRKDLHECFNNGWFAVVPKVAPDGSCQYVTHILGNRAAQIWPTYQNITIQRLLFESKAHLFSRFAWAIFQRVRNFIISGVPRRVNRLHIHDEEGYPEWKDEEAIGPLLTLLYGKEDTRNFKRKRLHSNGDPERSFASDGWASDNETENRPDLSDDVHKELKISVASLISSQYQQEIERSTLM